MIVKMACGAPGLCRHVSVESLRAAAAKLPPHALDSPLLAAMAAATGQSTAACDAALRRCGAAAGSPSADVAGAGGRGEGVATGDITVVRLAALRRWVDSGEYARVVKSCTTEATEEVRRSAAGHCMCIVCRQLHGACPSYESGTCHDRVPPQHTLQGVFSFEDCPV